MKFDFSKEAYYDNHTHLLFTKGMEVTPADFAINYYHGIRDAVDANGTAVPSETAVEHLRYQGANLMLINALHERFGSELSLEGATAFRNAHTKTAEDIKAYTEMLYKDANVVGCTLDCELPMGDPKTQCFPCEVYRLFRYEDVFLSSLKTEERFSDLVANVLNAIRRAKADGFDGLKCHVGEKYGGFDISYHTEQEAQQAMPAAKAGDKNAIRIVYHTMFADVMQLAAELDLPINIHTGTTGHKKQNAVYQVDPILMVPFLKDPRNFKTKIVFIHCSFPFTRNAAWMAYNFPNVYVDLSQTQLWQGVLTKTILEDCLSCAPHDKIMLGTGQHWYCEMVWLAARIAKTSLEEAMGRLVDAHYLAPDQAVDSARKILSENALRLYGKH